MNSVLLNNIKFDNRCLNYINNYLGNKKEYGIIYCISNEFFKLYNKNLYKIGKSNNDKSRLESYNMYYLDNIDIIHISKFNYYNDLAEDMIFDILRNYKQRNNREFFICDKDKIKLIIDDVVENLNKYNDNNNDVEIIKNIIINIPVLLLNILLLQKSYDDIYKLFDNNKQHINTIISQNIIDKLLDIDDKKDFIKILKVYNKKIIIHKNKINYEKDFLNYLENNISTLCNDTNVIDNYKNNNLINYLISNYYKNDNRCLEYYYKHTNTDDFIIDFDMLVKWLEIRKDNLKKLLTENYIENKDFKINKNNNLPGKPKENILLTSECFKKICMMSKTKKIEDVRMCFIELEKIVNKYKHYIIENN